MPPIRPKPAEKTPKAIEGAAAAGTPLFGAEEDYSHYPLIYGVDHSIASLAHMIPEMRQHSFDVSKLSLKLSETSRLTSEEVVDYALHLSQHNLVSEKTRKILLRHRLAWLAHHDIFSNERVYADLKENNLLVPHSSRPKKLSTQKLIDYFGLRKNQYGFWLETRSQTVEEKEAKLKEIFDDLDKLPKKVKKSILTEKIERDSPSEYSAQEIDVRKDNVDRAARSLADAIKKVIEHDNTGAGVPGKEFFRARREAGREAYGELETLLDHLEEIVGTREQQDDKTAKQKIRTGLAAKTEGSLFGHTARMLVSEDGFKSYARLVPNPDKTVKLRLDPEGMPSSPSQIIRIARELSKKGQLNRNGVETLLIYDLFQMTKRESDPKKTMDFLLNDPRLNEATKKAFETGLLRFLKDEPERAIDHILRSDFNLDLESLKRTPSKEILQKTASIICGGSFRQTVGEGVWSVVKGPEKSYRFAPRPLVNSYISGVAHDGGMPGNRERMFSLLHGLSRSPESDAGKLARNHEADTAKILSEIPGDARQRNLLIESTIPHHEPWDRREKAILPRRVLSLIEGITTSKLGTPQRIESIADLERIIKELEEQRKNKRFKYDPFLVNSALELLKHPAYAKAIIGAPLSPEEAKIVLGDHVDVEKRTIEDFPLVSLFYHTTRGSFALPKEKRDENDRKSLMANQLGRVFPFEEQDVRDLQDDFERSKLNRDIPYLAEPSKDGYLLKTRPRIFFTVAQHIIGQKRLDEQGLSPAYPINSDIQRFFDSLKKAAETNTAGKNAPVLARLQPFVDVFDKIYWPLYQQEKDNLDPSKPKTIREFHDKVREGVIREMTAGKEKFKQPFYPPYAEKFIRLLGNAEVMEKFTGVFRPRTLRPVTEEQGSKDKRLLELLRASQQRRKKLRHA